MTLFRSSTIAAVATPLGEGALAIIRISGPQTREVASNLVRTVSGKRPLRLSHARATPGYVIDPASGGKVDQCIFTFFCAPRSYTGEDMAEISCHGGSATTRAVLRSTLRAGAIHAEPGEFTQRAFLNGKLDLAQAEAVSDLIRARTDEAVLVARRLLDGALSESLGHLREDLIGALAAIEVTIDFSDEAGELDYAPMLQRISNCRARIEKMLQTAERGRAIREGIRVAIAGRPNAGKSSLLNALLQVERAIVSPEQGTTRDTIEEAIELCGAPVVLIDTAGIRSTEASVEQIGVERAWRAAETSDLVLLVVDGDRSPDPEDERLIHSLLQARANTTEGAACCSRYSERSIVGVAAKQDISADGCAGAAMFLRQRLPDVVTVSSLTGYGLQDLRNRITSRR
ncbi:MAG TPA: tRNA uridine-5-carboxymethylaminomethyl(34) synthesis GTPase MnmE, partial [Chthonomonadales bacterium]|nr:tRNA uridine-5-carboxymethylaminomethyl(34) synthesis GTPase MnmE [Chthonomonadales bacterium]